MAHRARLTSFRKGGISNPAIVQSSRARNGCFARARAIAAGRADSLIRLAVRETRGTEKAWSTSVHHVDSTRNKTIVSSRTRHGCGHLRAVAKAARGAKQRSHGCAPEVRAIPANGTRKAYGFKRRAGSEACRSTQVSACRAVAIDARVDGIEVAVIGPNVHGAVGANRGG